MCPGDGLNGCLPHWRIAQILKRSNKGRQISATIPPPGLWFWLILIPTVAWQDGMTWAELPVMQLVERDPCIAR